MISLLKKVPVIMRNSARKGPGPAPPVVLDNRGRAWTAADLAEARSSVESKLELIAAREREDAARLRGEILETERRAEIQLKHSLESMSNKVARIRDKEKETGNQSQGGCGFQQDVYRAHARTLQPQIERLKGMYAYKIFENRMSREAAAREAAEIVDLEGLLQAVSEEQETTLRHHRQVAIIRSTRGLGHYLPRKARRVIFEPFYRELRNDFVRQMAASLSPEESRRIERRFLLGTISLAVSALRLSFQESFIRALEWGVIALTGDAVVNFIKQRLWDLSAFRDRWF